MRYIDPGCEKFIFEAKRLEEEYSLACDWISSFGIDYKKTRFGNYGKDLADFVENKGRVDAKENIRQFFNAHLEANEIIRIKNAFDNFSGAADFEVIKKSVSGQRFRTGSATDKSRDFAFELGVASRFIKAGYNVELTSLSDVVAEVGGRTLFVECKRIKSFRQLEKRVKEAHKQLENRFNGEKSHLSRGMIALNITDILNPDSMPVLVNSFEDYRKLSSETLKSFVQDNASTLSKKRCRKTLAALTEFSTQGFVMAEEKEECSFFNCREGNIYFYPMKARDHGFINGFWAHLGDQNISG